MSMYSTSRLVDRADAVQRARSGQLVREDDPLRIRRRREEPPDWIAWQLAGEEQPVDRAVERELGGRAREDQEHHVSVAPDPPHDRTAIHEIAHVALACGLPSLARTFFAI
jgi:hypothetical protein